MRCSVLVVIFSISVPAIGCNQQVSTPPAVQPADATTPSRTQPEAKRSEKPQSVNMPVTQSSKRDTQLSQAWKQAAVAKLSFRITKQHQVAIEQEGRADRLTKYKVRTNDRIDAQTKDFGRGVKNLRQRHRIHVIPDAEKEVIDVVLYLFRDTEARWPTDRLDQPVDMLNVRFWEKPDPKPIPVGFDLRLSNMARHDTVIKGSVSGHLLVLGINEVQFKDVPFELRPYAVLDEQAGQE
jgi:hypothetical protein